MAYKWGLLGLLSRDDPSRHPDDYLLRWLRCLDGLVFGGPDIPNLSFGVWMSRVKDQPHDISCSLGKMCLWGTAT